ncbi:unnamed protein product, partial [Trichogramma brassicae]
MSIDQLVEQQRNSSDSFTKECEALDGRLYYDVNDLYGWAMAQYLPYGGFEWDDAKDYLTLPEDSEYGYILEVDLEYPESLYDSHKDLPLCPEHACPPGSKQRKLQAQISKPNSHSRAIFDENLVAIQLSKTVVTIDKPVYVGCSILDISKTQLYRFHYDFMRDRFKSNCKVLYTDTDSLVYEIRGQNVYEVMKDKDNINEFDTFDYEKDNPFGMPLLQENSKKIGLMKDKLSGKILRRFCGLRSKMYNVEIQNGGFIKKIKGIKSSVVKNTITFDDYLQCLRENTIISREQHNIRSRLHVLRSEKEKKIALSPHDDKRYLVPGTTDTLPWGHKDIWDGLGQRDRQAPGSTDEVGETSQLESSSLPSMPTKTMTPSAVIAASMTRRIIDAPLLAKDAPLPTPAEFATGSYEEKMIRIEGLVEGLNTFIFGKNNLHKTVIKYSLSLEQAILALKKTKQKQVPPRPPSAEKAVCTSPIFSVNGTGKRPATSPLATHATPKRHAVTAAFKQPDENNNDVGDQDGFVPVNHRRHREHAIVIKAKDASTYANILRTLKANQTLQQTVGSSVQNIRRSAAGALVLQLKKNVDNASTLGAKLDQVLGDAATATALQHTTMIEIRDLDECATKEEIAEALSTSLGAPSLNKEVVRTLRKAYAGTQAAVAALPDDLAAKALKLGDIRIGWVNCRIRGREDAPRCHRCWSPGHVSARCKGPDRSAHCFRCGQVGHQINDCKNNP